MGLIRQLVSRVLFTAEQRASLENPSTSLDDADDWHVDGGAHSDSGIRISHETALEYSPAWRAVCLLGGYVGKLPLITYKRNGKGKDIATDSPAYNLLRYKPNGEMTALQFRRAIQACAMLLGNGYAYIFRAGDASPLELIPLDPLTTYPVRVGGSLMYVTSVRGVERKLFPEDVFHIRGLGLNGLRGYRVIGKAKDSLGLGMAAEHHGSRFFKNSARPGVVLKLPKGFSPAAKNNLRSSWQEMYTGLDNAHKTALLEDGVDLTILSNTARDSQLIETRQQQIREVANWWGIPPHKLGDTTRSGYNSLESENQSFLDDCLDVQLVTWEEECRDKLLTEQQKADDSYTIAFRRQDLLRADTAARGAYYMQATGGHPWLTVNEVRGDEDLNPMDGFDDLKPPVNNFGDPNAKGKPGTKPPVNKPPTPAKKGDDDDDDNNKRFIPPEAITATRTVVVDAARRMACRLVTHARKAAKRPGELDKWLGKGLNAHRSVIVEALGPSIGIASALTGGGETAEAIADGMLSDFRRDLTDAGDGFATVLDHYEEAVPEVIAGRVIGETL